MANSGPPRPPPRKASSSPWMGRLKPSPAMTDPLESMGYISKGDSRLKDFRTQEWYHKEIVDRFMKWLADHPTRSSLIRAFASLSEPSTPTTSPIPSSAGPSPPSTTHSSPTKPSPITTTLPSFGRVPYISPPKRNGNPKTPPNQSAITLHAPTTIPSPTSSDPSPAATSSATLALLLESLRKLREALLSTKRLDTFSQRAHVFSIHVSILASHPVSYESSLKYLLYTIHPVVPLPLPELSEFTTYSILDTACRLHNERDSKLWVAYELRNRAAREFGYENARVDKVLSALALGNFWLFWKVRRDADGHEMRLLGFAEPRMRRLALKCLGMAYHNATVEWVEKCAGMSGADDIIGGGDPNGDDDEPSTWERLVRDQGLGWKRDGDRVVIRNVRKRRGVGVNEEKTMTG